MIETVIHKKKIPYKKTEAVKELERMADAEARRQHPTCPHLAPRKYRDDSSNNLTKCITAYLRLQGAFVSRLNNQGVYDRRLNRYRPGTNRKGLPDVLATYQDKSIMVEVKHGRDRMSIEQTKIMQEQIASGGLYFVAHDFASFKNWLGSL